MPSAPTRPRAEVDVIDRADRARAALSPARRQLLQLLRQPASATELAHTLGLTRQRVTYHLRALEAVGLVDVVDERRRRGFTERVFQARADRLIVDPAILGSPTAHAHVQDRFAAEHLIDAAASVVRDVARMQGAAQRDGTRLLTFAVESEVTFAAPADVHRFCDRLADAIRGIGDDFQAPAGRRFRIVAGCHPASTQTTDDRAATGGAS
jgi:DNA-binding transcriptional ArsR family regulator